LVEKICLIFPPALLFLFALLIVCAKPAYAAELEVGEDQPFKTISSALGEANNGDTIKVHPGIYQEKLIIDKSVTLESMYLHEATIQGDYDRHVILITSPGVTIKGFTITASGQNYLDDDAGIYVKDADGTKIIDNLIEDVLFGIYIDSSDNTLIENTSITGLEDRQFTRRGNGIHLYKTKGNTVDGVSIKETRDGIYFDFCDYSTVVNSDVSYVRYGLHYMSSDHNTFSHNHFSHNVSGAAVMFSQWIHLDNNVFEMNTGPRNFGMFFQRVEDSIVENNLFFQNSIGFYADLSYRNTFQNNTIIQNDVGMEILGSNWDNEFSENSFIDNLQQVSVNEIRVNDLWYKEGLGNYWSDYSGIDMTKNGIGDTEYRSGTAFEYLMQSYPHMRLFLESPAANMLKTVDAMFPVLERAEIVDEYPLMQDPNAQSLAQITTQSSQGIGLLVFCISLVIVAFWLVVIARVSRSLRK